MNTLDKLISMMEENYYGETDWDEDFLTNMYDNYDKYKEHIFISNKQDEQINRIYDGF